MPSLIRRLAKKDKDRSEKSILTAIKDYAFNTYGQFDVVKKTGLFMQVKLSTLAMYGAAGWPDQGWFVRGGTVFFIEGKRAGEVPTAIQQRRHDELRAMGFSVYVVDNVTSGKNVIDVFARKAKGRKAV